MYMEFFVFSTTTVQIKIRNVNVKIMDNVKKDSRSRAKKNSAGPLTDDSTDCFVIILSVRLY